MVMEIRWRMRRYRMDSIATFSPPEMVCGAAVFRFGTKASGVAADFGGETVYCGRAARLASLGHDTRECTMRARPRRNIAIACMRRTAWEPGQGLVTYVWDGADLLQERN